MLTGTNLKYTKAHNYRTVLETVRIHGPLSRADIARRSALTAQTISNIVSRLLDAELIQEAEKRREGRGAPSTTLKLNPQGAHAIGLDLDRDHLTGVLVNLSGQVEQREHFRLDYPSPDEAISLMAETANSLASAQGIPLEELSGLGIGFPGPFEVNGDTAGNNVVTPNAFPGWERVPVLDRIGERVDCPVFLKNNGTAAAVGERWYGEDHSHSTFFYLFFGIGLGGGIVHDGHPYEGAFGNAGEVGYIPTLEASLDDSASPPYIGEHFHLPTLYDQLEDAGYDASYPPDLAPLYDDNVPPIREWMDEALPHLTQLVLSIEYIMDPEMIFFGGRLPAPMIRELTELVEARLPEYRISGKAAAPTLKPATAGQDAAALGVATIPLYEFFAPAPHVLQKRKQNGQKRTSNV